MMRFFRTPPTDLDDATLLARFQRTRRPEDLTPLFDRYVELIYAQSVSYLGGGARAEDAVMELFEHLLKKLPKQEIHNFRSWLQTVVRNHCLMKLRREKRDPIRNSEELLVHSGPLAHLSTETPPEKDPRLNGLNHCLQQLKAEQRQCVRLFYLEEGNTYKSIAESLQLEVGRVRSHIQNGRRNLRSCLEKTVTTEEA